MHNIHHSLSSTFGTAENMPRPMHPLLPKGNVGELETPMLPSFDGRGRGRVG